MLTQCLPGILIPFAGTTLGSACVFFMKKTLHEGVQRALTGFAAGVMAAASIWSLLIPAMEQSKGLGRLAFIPAAVGFGVSTPEQAAQVAAPSDGAIVGSAIIKLFAQYGPAAVPHIEAFVRDMAQAVHNA